MNGIVKAKVALFIVAAILIGAGIRSDSASLRWTGIAFLAAAFLLRFVKRSAAE